MTAGFDGRGKPCGQSTQQPAGAIAATDESSEVNSYRPRVYISGPITLGDRMDNIRRAVAVYKELIGLGFAPLCPHLSHYAEVDHDCRFDHHVWIDIDLPWVDMADAVLRLDGESTGADQECERAQQRGVPVFADLEELRFWRKAMAGQIRQQPTPPVANSTFPPAVVAGLSPDAPTVVAANGAKQSDCPYAPDLYDPLALLEVSAVLKRGADKYGVDNWRGLTISDHLRHLLTHVYAFLAGDRSDNHLANAHCRAMFAHASNIDKTQNQHT